MPFDDDERPTTPDGPSPCPQCEGQCEVMATEWSGPMHRTRMVRCPLCGGRGMVGKATLSRFKAMATERPPPPELPGPRSSAPPEPEPPPTEPKKYDG